LSLTLASSTQATIALHKCYGIHLSSVQFTMKKKELSAEDTNYRQSRKSRRRQGKKGYVLFPSQLVDLSLVAGYLSLVAGYISPLQ
jgi:hypothetical protein